LKIAKCFNLPTQQESWFTVTILYGGWNKKKTTYKLVLGCSRSRRAPCLQGQVDGTPSDEAIAHFDDDLLSDDEKDETHDTMQVNEQLDWHAEEKANRRSTTKFCAPGEDLCSCRLVLKYGLMPDNFSMHTFPDVKSRKTYCHRPFHVVDLCLNHTNHTKPSSRNDVEWSLTEAEEAQLGRQLKHNILTPGAAHDLFNLDDSKGHVSIARSVLFFHRIFTRTFVL
jgi:hypothetical protein